MFDGSVHPSGEAAKAEGDEEEEDAPIDMSFPTDSPAKMIIYILSFPLMAPLYITLPDTKNNEFTIFPSLKIPGNAKIYHIINETFLLYENRYACSQRMIDYKVLILWSFYYII